MNIILCIETSDEICSVSVSNGKDEFSLESQESKSHAKVLTGLIEKILGKAGISLNDVEAVAVSSGPGSYTGLRIGISVAKGLCYSLDKPLISLEVFDILREKAIYNELIEGKKSFAMIDARRMEVYGKHWDSNGVQVGNAEAIILDEHFLELHSPSDTVFIGSGSHKLKELPNGIKVNTMDVRPDALNMLRLAQLKFNESNFEDTAYFEPFYLKEFYITKPKDHLNK